MRARCRQLRNRHWRSRRRTRSRTTQPRQWRRAPLRGGSTPSLPLCVHSWAAPPRWLSGGADADTWDRRQGEPTAAALGGSVTLPTNITVGRGHNTRKERERGHRTCVGEVRLYLGQCCHRAIDWRLWLGYAHRAPRLAHTDAPRTYRIVSRALRASRAVRRRTPRSDARRKRAQLIWHGHR